MKDKGSSNDTKKIFHIAGDIIWSVLALVIMNGTMQLLVNPLLKKWLGTESFGNYQSVFAVVAIMGTSLGVAANYSRMVKNREKKDTNGDYNIFLLISAVISLFAAFFTLKVYKSFTAPGFALLVLLMIFTILRYYGEVEFRLTLRFKGYFFYYLILTAGYCLGLLVFNYITPSWMLTMLCGEAAAVLFVLFYGRIFRGSGLLKRGDYFGENMRSFVVLTGTSLLTAITQNADRIILRLSAGGSAVTLFYVSTLLGKVVSLLTVPLSGVLISHLMKYEGKITKKMYAWFTVAILILGIVANLACFFGSIVFIKLFYKDLFADVRPYLFLATTSEIFFFISNCLMTVLLRVASEKYQMYINIVYTVIYFAAVTPATVMYGMWGLIISLMAVNLLKFVIVAAVGQIKVTELLKNDGAGELIKAVPFEDDAEDEKEWGDVN